MKNSFLIAMYAAIGIAIVLRFVGLEYSPPGFFIDEAFAAAHSLCYQQTGRDFFGKIGIFSKIDYSGYEAAPYLIGSAMWTKIFGVGFAGFRSFAAFIGSATVCGIYFLMRGLYPARSPGVNVMALWATLLGAMLPWAFQFSRISWDAPLATCFMVWGLALVYWQKEHNPLLRSLAGAALLGLASYTYAPMRIQVALLVLMLPGIAWRRHVWIAAMVGVMNIPVLFWYADPAFTARSKQLSLFSHFAYNPYRDETPFGLVLVFIRQFFSHFSPRFLLFSGDKNIRHSTQSTGMLDWVTAIGWAIGLLSIAHHAARKSIPPAACLMLLGIISGILPAALTWEGVPHAIRGMGAWPFFVMIAAQGWELFYRRWPTIQYALLPAAVLSFGFYLYSYFVVYPGISKNWYDVPFVTSILTFHAYPKSYSALPRGYYEMAFFGKRCEEVRIIPPNP